MSNVNSRIITFARSTCAGSDGKGGCRYEPNGQTRCSFERTDPQALPFIEAGDMRCFYFEKSVLPSDPALKARYFNEDANVTKCASCDKPIVRESNRQKYCGTCGTEAARKGRNKRTSKSRHKTDAIPTEVVTV